jgi:SAM-dependent methyltransferase
VTEPFDYEAATWGGESLRAGERSIAGYRLDEVLSQLPERGRVLEVGCGEGRYLRALFEARPQLRLVGCDISRSALEGLARREPGIEVRRIEGPRLPAADGEFDAVLVVDVLEHVDDPAGLLREAHRVLAPNGVFHLHVPCEADPRALWRWLPGQAGARGLKRRLGGHIQRFRRNQVLALLAANGFEVQRVRNSLHLLGNLADVAAFLRLDAANRDSDTPITTADLLSASGFAARVVDPLIWAEARLLSWLPSWSIHVWCKRAPDA